MKGRITFIALAMLVSVVMGTAPSCSRKGGSGSHLKEYSADVITTTPRGEFRGTIFVKGGMSRMEFPQSVVITRQDKGTVWVLMPAQKRYLEHGMKPEYAHVVDGKFPGEVSRELVGAEKIDGRQTDKYRVTYTLGDDEVAVYQWVCTQSGMPLKTAAVDGSWAYSITNVKVGSQPNKLFELPAGYSKFAIPKFKPKR